MDGNNNYYAIEAGGTKFVCAWGTGPDDINDRISIPTTTPEETMPQIIEHIKQSQENAQKKSNKKIKAIGAAIFGPLGLNPEFDSYGHITATPKLPWRNFDIIGELKKQSNLNITFDTDVNIAAMGEHKWGAAKNISDFIYITVGTGVGAGAIINNQICHGAMHPEMGHILIPKHKDDPGNCVCPYHDSCIEGLAAGPSLKERWNVESAELLDKNHQAWEIESYYLATALVNYTLCLSPKKIIMGGGVMQQEHLFKLIRKDFIKLLAGYMSHPYISDIDNYIVPPMLKNNAGISGAIALAKSKFD